MNAKLIAAAAALAIAHFAIATTKTSQPNTPPSTVSSSSAIRLTKPQAEAAGMIDVVENFERIDANNDGVITRNEMRAYLLATRRHAPMT